MRPNDATAHLYGGSTTMAARLLRARLLLEQALRRVDEASCSHATPPYRLSTGVADGVSSARVWTCRYS